VYSSLRLSGPACVASSASSSTAPMRYTRGEDNGYTVERSDWLPSVPAAGPLGAIAGGPVYHITGKFDGATKPLVNESAAVIGVDTAADEPNGYPAWVSPFVSGLHMTSARTMDFLGTATWSASESPVAGLGCMVVDFMLGTGVAVYNNPLPVGLGTLTSGLMTPNPQAAELIGQINDAVTGVVDKVASDPTVDALLGQVLGLLPGVPALP
jgi:hypothetical protein